VKPFVVAVAVLLAGCSSTAARAVTPTSAASTAAPATTAPTTTAPATTSTTVDPGTLPQTMARPSASDPAFVARMALLWQAVVNGDATVALPAFFPESAYLQVKNISNPDADWHGRLVRLYNKGSYWRVYGSVVHYEVDGRSSTFVIQSLISWRGEWYVVHLTTPPS